MRIADCHIIFIGDKPTLSDDHWMLRWEDRFPHTNRFHVPDQEDELLKSVDVVADAIEASDKPVVAVTFGTGAYLLAHAVAKDIKPLLQGAFLVNPPVQKHKNTGKNEEKLIATNPEKLLTVPSVLIGSQSSDWGRTQDLGKLASLWGGEVIDAGDVGNLDESSGHGPWPEGMMSLAGFLKRF